MAYYIRVFCTSSTPPSLRKLVGWIHDSGGTLHPSRDEEPVTLDSTEWNGIEFHYRNAWRPVIVDLDKDDGTEACLFRQEVREFMDLDLAALPESPQKSKVIVHLRASKYVIAIDVPTSNFEDQDFEKLGVFINHIAMFCGGMVQADGEGFYEGNRLIVGLS
jgi:hypothetical protein